MCDHSRLLTFVCSHSSAYTLFPQPFNWVWANPQQQTKSVCSGVVVKCVSSNFDKSTERENLEGETGFSFKTIPSKLTDG